MYQISKQFAFEASHQLTGLTPSTHPCMRMHGHSYRVELVLERYTLDERGFVVDYGDMAPFEHYLKSMLDHQHLNLILDINPTAENIARHLYDVAWALFHDVRITVRVSETQKTWASFTET